MEAVLSLFVGIGLSAACGFRIFVPLFIASLAVMTGHITVGESFQWLGTPTALVTFAAATFFEIMAYFIPFVDNFLDHIAAPMAVVAGAILTASFGYQLDPYMKWTLAVIAGGGSAAIVHGAAGMTRLASTAATAGTGNFMVAVIEAIGAVILSAAAIFLPVLAIVFVLLLAYVVLRRYLRGRRAGLVIR